MIKDEYPLQSPMTNKKHKQTGTVKHLIMSKAPQIALILVVCTGGCIRLTYLSELQEFPEFQVPMPFQVDMGFIDNSALAHAQNGRAFYGLPAFPLQFERQVVWTANAGNPQLRPPAYTFFLAFLYFILGDNQFGIRLAQMLLGLASALLGYQLGKTLFSRWCGVAIATGLLFYWPLLLYESVIHEPVLVVFFSLLFLNAALRWYKTLDIKSAAWTGFLCGLYTVAAAQIILFFPVLVGWMSIVCIFIGCMTIRKMAMHVCTVILFFFLALVPISTLNFLESGLPVMNSFGQGITLYIGNQPGASGYIMPSDALMDEYFADEGSSFRVDERVARIDDWPRWAAMSRKAAIESIQADPVRFLALSLKRAVLFWTPHEVSQNVLEYCDRLFSSVLSRLPGNFGAISAFAFIGMYHFFRRVLFLAKNKAVSCEKDSVYIGGYSLILLLIISWYAPYTVLWISSHFRVPLLPCLLAFAAIGALNLIQDLKNKRLVRAVMSGMVVAGFALMPVLLPRSYDMDIETWLYYRTRYYREHDNWSQSVEIAKRVVERVPKHAFSQKTYADLLFEKGQYSDAIEHYQIALACANERISRGDILENMGTSLRQSGDIAGALEAFTQVITLEPENGNVLHSLGNIAYEQGRYGDALIYLEQSRQINPELSNTYFLLGLTYIALDKPEMAESVLKQGLQVDPNDLWIVLKLSDILMMRGKYEEACALLKDIDWSNPVAVGVTSTYEDMCI